jgi:uncharacterized protein YcfJ
MYITLEKEKQMLKSIVVSGVLLASLTACQMNNQTGGTLIGAGAGGLLGSQVGGGSGRLIATGVGTLIGAVAGSSVGQSMDQKQTVIYKEVGADVCSDYKSNEGAYASCQRGVAQRNAEMQRRLENEAYNQGLGK